MSRSQPLQQGRADGLCGIYTLLNFFRNHELGGAHKEPLDNRIFRFLMDAAEQLNLLTASRLCSGFEWYQLRDVFNLTAKNLRCPYVAVSISAVAEQIGSQVPYEVVGAVTGEGGEVVLSLPERDHWVLAHCGKVGEILIDDSWSKHPEKKLPFTRTSKVDGDSVDLSEGLALILKSSPLAESV